MKVLLPATSSSDIVLSNEQCQICLQPAHGYHFGAFTCRACAAFFRRCHFSPNTDPKCRLRIGKCQPSVQTGRWSCKKCRLERCLEIGMTPTNIQYDRDAFKSSVSFLKNRTLVGRIGDRIGVPMTLEKALGIPHLVAFLGRRDKENGEVAFIDISGLAKMAVAGVLNPVSIKKFKKGSNLIQLAQGLEDYQSTQKELLTELQFVTQEEQSMDWKRNMLETAKWMNYSDAIRSSDDDYKVDLLRSIWFVWARLERICMTAKMRVNGQCGKRQFVLSLDSLIDYDKVSTDISWWSSYSFEELGFFFNPTEVFYDDIIDEIIELQPDKVEMTFLIAVICLHLTEMRRDGDTEVETSRLQDTLANDLHEYYIGNDKTMYLLRLKQLMKIKQRFLELCRKRYEKYSIGGCFDMFEMQFSHPDFFRVPC